MKNKAMLKNLAWVAVLAALGGCKVADLPVRSENRALSATFSTSTDSTNTASLNWQAYFSDADLAALIDTALRNNQELNIMLQEIEMGRNEVMARTGEYRPFGSLAFGTGVEHSGKYTWDGVSEEDLKSSPEDYPRFVGDQSLKGVFSWELDVWKKLHNAKDAAMRRYLSSMEGRNFVVTNLVAEIANAYYELIVLDNQLDIVQKSIKIQQDALATVKVQKDAARVNELAVKRFEAQVLSTQNLQFEIRQMITETENKINFLVGRYPQPVRRSTPDLNTMQLQTLTEGVPSQLLANRSDIRQAEQELEASKLDVKVAKANFYPNVTLRAGVGFQAFNPIFLIHPKSIAFNVLGDLVAPIVNKNAIKATYANASLKQLQAVYRYEQTLLNAYTEVVNALAGRKNYSESFDTKLKQVNIANESIGISNSLFKSARADYTEVLLTQREALEAAMELTEIKKKQVNASINLYKALGGGWR